MKVFMVKQMTDGVDADSAMTVDVHHGKDFMGMIVFYDMNTVDQVRMLT